MSCILVRFAMKGKSIQCHSNFFQFTHQNIYIMIEIAICVTTLFSFIFAGLKFRENFLGTFRETLISRSRRKIVFAGN